MRFVDTNVLLYAVSRESTEAGKADRANELLFAGDVALSVQVLQEFLRPGHGGIRVENPFRA